MPLPMYEEKSKSSSIQGVKNIILVGAGKGGVGKSTLSVELAYQLTKLGLSVGLLDADLYGPSLGRMLRLEIKPKKLKDYLVPGEAFGFKLMTMSFFREAALVARAPMVSGTITQFLHKVDWGNLDVLLIDLPPGTGDIPLTLSQSVPLKGAVLITTPQKVACDDVEKAAQLFQQVNIPILGLVENLAFYTSESGQQLFPFGSGGGQSLSQKWNVPLMGQLEIDEGISKSADIGFPFSMKYPDARNAHVFRKISEMLHGITKEKVESEHLGHFYLKWKEFEHATN